MNRQLYQEIVELIAPYMDDRRAIFQEAFYGSTLLEKIDFEGGNRQFANSAIRKMNQFGAINGKPAVVALLQTLRKQVGHDVATQIDNLISQAMTETAAETDDKTMQRSNSALITGVVIVIAVLGVGTLLFTLFGRGATPAQPTSAPAVVPPPAQESPNSANFMLIYEGADGLTLAVNEFSDFNALALASPDATIQLNAVLPELNVFGGMPPANTCFRLLREGASPPLPSACNGADVFETNIADADIFWYNDLENRVNSLAVRYNGENLKVCTSATPRCDVVAEFGEQN